jgi:tetratricopeptide (TPR) repeat protein
MRHHSLLTTMLLLVPLFALSCASVPAYEKTWIEARTENFEIVSDRNRAATLEIARNLEIFRAAAQEITNVRDFKPAVPTRIYAFQADYDYRRYAPRGSAAVIYPSMRSNDILLSNDRSIEGSAMAQHEYGHFLLRNRSALVYPFWYDEGFAELLGAVRITDGEVQIGIAPKYRLSAFQQGVWIPIQRIVKSRSGDEFNDWDTHMAYAESWALVHYLHFGREEGESTSKQMASYISQVDQGVSIDDAWREVFGVGLESLNRTLINYLEGKIPAMGIPVDPYLPDTEPDVRAIPKHVIATELGWLSITIGRPAQAQKEFEAAIAASPLYARAHVGLGDAYKFQDRWDEAQPHYKTGLELDDKNALNHLDVGWYFHDLARITEDADLRRERARTARQHYTSSWKLDPDLPETYFANGSSFLLDGEDPARGIESLEHAHSLVRWDLLTQMFLAKAYAHVGRDEDARELLQTVLAWSKGGGLTAAAEELLRELDDSKAMDDGIPVGGGQGASD